MKAATVIGPRSRMVETMRAWRGLSRGQRTEVRGQGEVRASRVPWPPASDLWPLETLRFRHRDEHLLPITPDEKEHGVTRLRGLQRAPHVGGTVHRLLVHFEDHVARLDARPRGGAVALHAHNDCATLTLGHPEPASAVGRDALPRHPAPG